MTQVTAAHVLLFGLSGASGTLGGLLLHGNYLFSRSYPAYGIALLMVSAALGAIFVALVDEPDESNNRPPN